MMAVAARPRHDAADLRRLAELGITPLHWRRSLAQPRLPTNGNVLVIHDDVAADPLLDDLLRAIALAGMSPRMSSSGETTATVPAARVIRLGRDVSMANSPRDDAGALVLPGLDELRGNALAKRGAWLKLRTLLQQ